MLLRAIIMIIGNTKLNFSNRFYKVFKWQNDFMQQ